MLRKPLHLKHTVAVTVRAVQQALPCHAFLGWQVAKMSPWALRWFVIRWPCAAPCAHAWTWGWKISCPALETLTAREFTQARLLGVTGAPLTLASGAVGVEIIECVWDHAPRCTVGSKVLHKLLCWKRPVTVTVRAVQRAALKNVP